MEKDCDNKPDLCEVLEADVLSASRSAPSATSQVSSQVGPSSSLDEIKTLPFGVYRGDDFMKFRFAPKEKLIDSLINKGDSVLMIGGPKAGKSLLIKQMVCSLTSASPFLEKYEVNGQNKVLYVQLEGEAPDTKDRLDRISKVVPLESGNLSIFYSEPMRLESELGLKDFYSQVDLIGHKFDVIIVDGLYLAFHGSLSDDEVVRQVLGNFRMIKKRYGCTLIVVHHTHKTRFNKDGDLISEGDEAVFGSQFLRAWPDHIIMLTHEKRSDLRHLVCLTQRSGEIEASITMRLIQPDPLYFETLDEVPKGTILDKSKESILSYLNAQSSKSAKACDIMKETGIPKSSFFHVAKLLIKETRLFKDGKGRTCLYRTT